MCAAALLKATSVSQRSSCQVWREPFSTCPSWQTLRRPASLPLNCDLLLVWTEEEEEESGSTEHWSDSRKED